MNKALELLTAEKSTMMLGVKLPVTFIGRIDAVAKTHGKTRSAVVQALLVAGLPSLEETK